MKSLAVLSLAFFATISVSVLAKAQISKSQLNWLALEFHQEFDRELAAKNQSFIINRPPTPDTPDFWWNRPNVRASYGSYTDPISRRREHYIFVMGGYASMKGLGLEGAILTICHELGHGLGGAPFKDKISASSEDPVSIEAVADDWAVRFCFAKMAKRPSIRQALTASTDQVAARVCREKSNDEALCLIAFKAFEFDRQYFKNDPEISQESFFDQKDSAVAAAINTLPSYYPSAQCRIDTMMAGFFGEARPRCWWAP